MKSLAATVANQLATWASNKFQRFNPPRIVLKRPSVATALAFAALASCPAHLFAEDSIPKIHTYADMEAEITRNAERHNEGLLSSGKIDFDDTEFMSSLFDELPLSERAVSIIASFAQEILDGEKAEFMYYRLTCEHYPHVLRDSVPPTTPADRAYTRDLFKTIHSFSDEQLKSFCNSVGDYERFRKNLHHWEKVCAGHR